jgi:excisionase family DNA binding protein
VFAGPGADDELLSTEEVAQALGVEPITVYRWCRQGRLACLKPGKAWRVRRSALEAFLRRAERPRTLAAHLGAFLEIPDQVLAVAEDATLLARLDAAFFQVGEAQGAVMVKIYDPQVASQRALAWQFLHHGLDTERLESVGRFRWCPAGDPDAAVASLRQLLGEETRDGGRPVWATFDWGAGVELDAALRQQAALAELVTAHAVVVMTGVIEPAVDLWPEAEWQWRLLGSLRGVVRFAQAGVLLSRVVAPPEA